MKIASILLSLALLTAPAVAQQPEPATETAVRIPREYTPTYDCIVGFFEARAYQHLSKKHFNRVLDILGIPHDSPLKDRLIQITLLVWGQATTVTDLSEHENDMQAWEEAQYKAIEKEARDLKALYDTFLDEVDEAGLDSDYVHNQIVEEGRSFTSITIIGDTDLDQRDRAIYRLFEDADDTNPWLAEE